MFAKAKAFIARLWAAAPVATTVLAVALVASAVFGVRSALDWHHRPPWHEQAQAPAPWMTPRYVARAWHIPMDDVLTALDAPRPPPNGPMSLSELAEYRGVPLEQVIGEINDLIAKHHPDPKPEDRK